MNKKQMEDLAAVHKLFSDKDMGRKEANREILHLLSELNEAHDDLRFGQMLAAFRISDDFYKESTDILKEMSKYVKILMKVNKK